MSDKPRFQITQAVIDGLNKKHAPTDNPMTRLLARVESTLDEIHRNINPILKAGGGHDELALHATVFALVQQGLASFSKDEMHQILSILVSDRVMTSVKANPRGNDKPDLLS